MKYDTSIQIGDLELNDSSVFRCVNCYYIPLVSLIKDNDEPKISYICQCTLNEKSKNKIISIEDFLNDFLKISLSSLMCNDDNCNNENDNEMIWCLTCNKSYCNKCMKNHKEKYPGHEIMELNKIDNYCRIHQDEKLVGWCKNCKVNICSPCIGVHDKCEYHLLSEMDVKKQDIKNYQSSLKKLTLYFYNELKTVHNKMIQK